MQATRVSVLSQVALPPAMEASRKLAANKPPRLPNGADHQLPRGVLTQDDEAEPDRPAQQRVVGVEGGTWAAEEPSGKHADAHQQAEQAQLADGDLR